MVVADGLAGWPVAVGLVGAAGREVAPVIEGWEQRKCRWRKGEVRVCRVRDKEAKVKIELLVLQQADTDIH